MPGRGPVPKRSEERRRGDRSETGITLTRVSVPDVDVVVAPANPDWHPIARGFYESLSTSGQSRFYEPSDWALAYLVCHMMDEALEDPKGISAAKMGAIMAPMGDLLITEGARRRARVELTRASEPEVISADVTALDAYRKIAQRAEAV